MRRFLSLSFLLFFAVVLAAEAGWPSSGRRSNGVAPPLNNYLTVCLGTETGCSSAALTNSTVFSASSGTLVTKIVPGAGKGIPGNSVRLTLISPASGADTVITALYIGLSQTTGTPTSCGSGTGICPWNFQSGSQVQVTFSGASGITLTCCNQLFVTDLVSFSQSGGTQAISVAANISSGSRVMRLGTSSTRTLPNTFGTLTGYYKTGVSQAATALKQTSYSTISTAVMMVQKIEVQ